FGEKCDSKSSESTVEQTREPTKFRSPFLVVSVRVNHQ
ncbi:unnamed protein product, partial [Brassica oleracea]